jgi:hypothetical protein
VSRCGLEAWVEVIEHQGASASRSEAWINLFHSQLLNWTNQFPIRAVRVECFL